MHTQVGEPVLLWTRVSEGLKYTWIIWGSCQTANSHSDGQWWSPDSAFLLPKEKILLVQGPHFEEQEYESSIPAFWEVKGLSICAQRWQMRSIGLNTKLKGHLSWNLRDVMLLNQIYSTLKPSTVILLSGNRKPSEQMKINHPHPKTSLEKERRDLNPDIAGHVCWNLFSSYPQAVLKEPVLFRGELYLLDLRVIAGEASLFFPFCGP